MSRYEEDSGLVGDALAELVNRGKLTDLEVLAWLGNQSNRARDEKVSRLLDELDAEGWDAR
jgi:hypothetical protein